MESIKELRKICQDKKKMVISSWYSGMIGRKISIYFTKLFILMGFTANQVTILMLIIGLIGCFFLALHNMFLMLIGAVILNFTFLLDLVDGELARYHYQHNLVGIHIEQIYHQQIPKFMYFGVALSVFLATGKLTAIVFGFLCVIFSTSIVFTTLAWELVRIRLLEKKYSKYAKPSRKDNNKISKENKKTGIEIGEIGEKETFVTGFLRKFKALWTCPYDKIILTFLIALEIINLKIHLIDPYNLLYWYIIFYGTLFSIIQTISFIINIRSKTIEIYQKELFE